MLVAASGGLSFAALSLPGWIEQRLRAALAERLQADIAAARADAELANAVADRPGPHSLGPRG